MAMENLTFFAKTIYQTVSSGKSKFNSSDYPDLTNQKWMVTGATGGIGLETAKILARLNAELWIVGRNTEKLESCVEKLLAERTNSSGNVAKIHALTIDYTDLTTVKPAVDQLVQKTPHLNGVIHNAGVMDVPGAETKQGLDVTIGVNNCATQLLQDLLDPLLLKVPDARIIWLSSAAHTFAPKNGFDLDSMGAGSAKTFSIDKLYAMSKALSIIQSVGWSLNHADSSIKSIAVHPGLIRSDLSRHIERWRAKMFRLMDYETWQGALAPIFAALSPDAENNSYIIPFGVHGSVRPDIERAARNEHGVVALRWIQDQIHAYK